MDRRHVRRMRVGARLHDGGLRRLNWRHIPRRRMNYTQAQRQRAIGFREHGFSYRQIAQQIGLFCSPGTIFQWVRRAQQQAQPPQ